MLSVRMLPGHECAVTNRPHTRRSVLMWRELLAVTRNPADVAGRMLIFAYVSVLLGEPRVQNLLLLTPRCWAAATLSRGD